MVKYHITPQLTLVSDTFGQFIHRNNNRKDVYIHCIMIVLDPTDYTEAVANKPILQFQITKKTETAIVPLSPTCRFRLHDAVVDIELDVAGTDIDYLAYVPEKLYWLIEFKTPLRLTAVENIFFGAISIYAGVLSWDVLVSEKDVS